MMYRQRVGLACPEGLSSSSGLLVTVTRRHSNLPYKTRFHTVGYENQRSTTHLGRHGADKLGMFSGAKVERGTAAELGEEQRTFNGRSGGDSRGMRRDSAAHSASPRRSSKPWAQGEDSPFGSPPKPTAFQDTPEYQSSPSSTVSPVRKKYSRNTSIGAGGYYPSLYHGLSPENLDTFGQSEAEYRSGVAEPLEHDAHDGSRKTLIAPVMESLIPGFKAHTSFLGTEGSYLRSEDPTKQPLLLGNQGDRANELNTKFDNKVRNITSSGMPLLERSSLLLSVSRDVQLNDLSLSARSFEDILTTWSAASLELQSRQHLELEAQYTDLLEFHAAKLADYKEDLRHLDVLSRRSSSTENGEDKSGTAAQEEEEEEESLRKQLEATQQHLEQEAGQLESLKYLVDCSRVGAAAASGGEIEGEGTGVSLRLTGGGGDPAFIPLLDKMLDLYYFMRGKFSAPSPAIMEHLMLTLGRVSQPSERIMNAASRLLLDSDHYTVLPSNVTWATYIQICGTNSMMSHATVRYVDALRKLHITPCSSMAMAMIEGYTKQGMVEEGLRYVGELDSIEMTTPLVNSILNLMLLSNDPTTVFSAYESSFLELQPNSATFTVQLLACEKLNLWGKSVDILKDMQNRRLKGDPTTLNLLLKGMLRLGRKAYAEQLYLSMKSKGVEVWANLEEGFPKGKQSVGRKLDIACRDKDEASRRQLLRGLRHGGQLVAIPSKQRGRDTVGGDDQTVDDEHHEGDDPESPRIAYLPQNNDPASTHGGGAPDRGFFVPKSLMQLKKFGAENKLGQVHPEYLRNFLFSKGVHLRTDWTHRDLIKRTHMELFGVWPKRAAAIVPHRSRSLLHRV